MFIPISVIAQPSVEGEFSVYWVSDHPVYTPPPPPPPEPELSFSILSNCYAYVQYVYPQLPRTEIILKNLGASGEVAVFYYPDSGLYHYAVVESIDPLVITDTNFSGHKKETRQVSSLRLLGFYDL